DAIFIAGNLVLVVGAFVGLTAFGVFFDIFAALAFVSLVFGLCRSYAATQRGRAIGNDDYRPQFDPDTDRWLALARLRFVPDPGLDERALGRRIREYRRRLRGFVLARPGRVPVGGHRAAGPRCPPQWAGGPGGRVPGGGRGARGRQGQRRGRRGQNPGGTPRPGLHRPWPTAPRHRRPRAVRT